MGAAENSIVISIFEVACYIKEIFKEYLAFQIQNGNYPTNLKDPCNYDPTEFLDTLVKEMFSENAVKANSIGTKPSTGILIRDGLDTKTAPIVALNAFKQITDRVAIFIPDMEYENTDKYLVGYSEGDNLMITKFRSYDEDQ